jgi:DNA-binding phage protein
MKKKINESVSKGLPKKIKVENDNLREFYINLQKAISDTGLTCYALSKKLGLDRNAVRNAVKGSTEPRLSTIIRIVKGMQISLDGLLGNEVDVKPILPESSPPVSKVEVRKNDVKLIDKTNQLHERDLELLESIANILIDRRSLMMKKLLNAIQKVDQDKEDKKENFMIKPSEEHFGQDDTFEEDIFEDDDENFEDDDDLEGSDGFDEDGFEDENDDDDDDDFDED